MVLKSLGSAPVTQFASVAGLIRAQRRIEELEALAASQAATIEEQAQAIADLEAATADTGWSASSLSITNYSDLTLSLRTKAGWGVLKLVGMRSSGNISGVDSNFGAVVPLAMRPSERAYGQATVASTFSRAYVESNGELHINPFTINASQNFQVYVTWPIGA